jgi:hypothetical protein
MAIRLASSAKSAKDAAIEDARQRREEEDERRRNFEHKLRNLKDCAVKAAMAGMTSYVIEWDDAIADWLRERGFSVKEHNRLGYRITESRDVVRQTLSSLRKLTEELCQTHQLGDRLVGVNDPSAILSYLEWYWKSGKLGRLSRAGALLNLFGSYPGMKGIARGAVESGVHEIQRQFMIMKRHERICRLMGDPLTGGDIDLKSGLRFSWRSGSDLGGQCCEVCSAYLLWISRWWREVSRYMDDLIDAASNNGLGEFELMLFYSGNSWSIFNSEAAEGSQPIWFSPPFISEVLKEAGYKIESEILGPEFKVSDLNGRYSGICGAGRGRFSYKIRW